MGELLVESRALFVGVFVVGILDADLYLDGLHLVFVIGSQMGLGRFGVERLLRVVVEWGSAVMRPVQFLVDDVLH